MSARLSTPLYESRGHVGGGGERSRGGDGGGGAVGGDGSDGGDSGGGGGQPSHDGRQGGDDGSDDCGVEGQGKGEGEGVRTGAADAKTSSGSVRPPLLLRDSAWTRRQQMVSTGR